MSTTYGPSWCPCCPSGQCLGTDLANTRDSLLLSLITSGEDHVLVTNRDAHGQVGASLDNVQSNSSWYRGSPAPKAFLGGQREDIMQHYPMPCEYFAILEVQLQKRYWASLEMLLACLNPAPLLNAQTSPAPAPHAQYQLTVPSSEVDSRYRK